MSHTLRSITLVIACIASLSANADPKTPGTHKGYSTIDMTTAGMPTDVKMISVADIQKKLQGKAPFAVGFDIDDTTLFSTPVFYRGQQEFSPNGYAYLTNQDFWDKANCGWDAFSMPKNIAKELIAMHQERGDSIYFITGRTGSDCNFTTEYLKKTFDIKVYYGDADGDIISARDAGAEGIRVMRAANSSYTPIPKNGIYGE